MRLGLAVIAMLSTAPAALALTEPPPPGPLAIGIIETYLMPRYESFQRSTADQAKAWGEACADGDFAPDLKTLRERYAAAADGWATIEHVTTGPMSVGLRADRIFFAPDRRNVVAKSLAELEGRAKNGDISVETIQGVSVAGQGFPALERLLYETDDADAKTRCRVGVAIAGNLASIASGVVDEWRSDTGPLARLKKGEGDPVHFADPAQAAARLMTDLAGGIQRVNDLKILPVMGGAPDMARPKAAEGWRSGRSARAIKVSTASLAAMAKAFAAAAPKDVAAVDGKAFAAAEAAVAKLPDDLGDAAADPKRRKTLEAAVAALKVAQNDLVKNLAPALGVPLGFNALDGD
ncbi:imelysin family protein [Hansschlegelia plantiphila]|uniref:Signal peptidase n=1 Tax=Hansschlegelia plantiphila TaxID=374655 RepID=A0A9W6MTU7_9HYPH|nr:imelysin family protein [Hansschlegelia plantiphila]GLK66729.1 signal peptidase [Hansschlegelia plantiphila]